MRVITAPSPEEVPYYEQSLFLAGGISGCGDWQQDCIKALSDISGAIYNPRRPGTLDRKNMEISKEQIAWERRRLEIANHILFWFPDTSVCPIALFELGGALDRLVSFRDSCGCAYNGQTLYIGCHPNYDRIVDLKIQLPLILNEEVQISSSVDELITRFRATRS